MSTPLNIKQSGSLILGAGTFDVPAGTVLQKGTSIKGVPGQTILQGPTKDGYLIHIQADDITLDGLIFSGGGVFCDKPDGSMNDSIVINNNEFHQSSSGQWNHGVGYSTGLSNSQITNNLYTGYNGGFGIFGYKYNGLNVSNNEFVNVVAACHLDAQGPKGGQHTNHNLLAEQNYMTGCKGMGLEYQGNGQNIVVQDNWYEHPNLSATASQNTGCMAFSIILDGGADILIQRNTVIAPERPDGLGCRVGFELGGLNSVCQDNYINGINISAADNDGESSPGSVVFQNNQVINNLARDYQSFPTPMRTYKSSNNTPTTKLTWDPANRPRPQRNVRYGTAPTPTPSPTMPDSPSGTYINSVGPTLVIGGVSCGISAGARVSIGNVPDVATSGVIGVLSFGGKFYQQQAGQWWLCADVIPKIGSKYTTSADPRSVTPPPPIADPIVEVDVKHASGKVDVSKP